MSSQVCYAYLGVYILIITVMTVESACPAVETPVIVDMCNSTTHLGNKFHIDSAMMANGFDHCSCNLTTTFDHSLNLEEVIPGTQCQAYWYNASIPLNQHPQVITYEYKHNRCQFPLVLGTISQSSLPWIISITRRSDGLVAPREGDPGFCLEVYSGDENEFTIACGDTISTPPSTTTPETTTGIQTTTASATTVVTEAETLTTESPSSTFSDNVTTPLSGHTSTVDANQTEITETADFNTTSSTLDVVTTPRDTSTTSGSTTVEVSLPPSVPTQPTTTDTQSMTVKPVKYDPVVIGVSVAGVLLFIILLAACIYISRKMTRKYTMKDVENVVYLPHQPPK